MLHRPPLEAAFNQCGFKMGVVLGLLHENMRSPAPIVVIANVLAQMASWTSRISG